MFVFDNVSLNPSDNKCSVEGCSENQNTDFIFNNIFGNEPLRDNVCKYVIVWQIADVNAILGLLMT